MPSHAPRYLAPIKQMETLAKREARLRHAIHAEASSDAIDAAAEAVRRSQLSVLKARRELLRYRVATTEGARELASISKDEALWRAMDAAQIAVLYAPPRGADLTVSSMS